MFLRSGARGRTRIGLLAGLAVVLLATACGYRSLVAPSEATSASPDAEAPAPTRLSVIAIRNDSPEPWLDRVVTDALRREIDSRGTLRLVDDPGDADLVVRGRVRPLDIQSKTFSSFVAALEYSVTVALDLEVVLSRGGIVRLDSTALSESEVYLASADIEVTRTNRLEALRRLSDVLAARVADSIELLERPIEDPEEGA